MPVSITINGDNAPQALLELGEFARGLIGKGVSAPVSEPTEPEQPKTGRGRGRGKTESAPVEAQSGQQISSGGERNDSNEGKVDAAATAPVEPPKPAEPEKPKLTLDDVRKAAQPYIDKWEMKVAGVDLGFALKDAVGKSRIAELEGADQETLAKAMKAFTEAFGDGSARYAPKGE